MKKCLQLLLVLSMMIFGAQSAMAAGLLDFGTGVSEKKIYDADRLIEIEKIAIASPIYTPTTSDEPAVEDLPEILMEATVADKKGVFDFISYREVCQGVKVVNRVDINRLDKRKAFSEYKKYVGKYADAYVVTTVSNGTTNDDGTRLNIFYDVYDANTNNIIYSYRKLAPKNAPRDTLLYTEITKDFYKDLISDQKDAAEEKEKADREAKKLAEKEAKKAAKAAEKAARG